MMIDDIIRGVEHYRPKSPYLKNGCVCQDCGESYQVDLNIPDWMWEKIKPGGKENGAGLLCPLCIIRRMKEKGFMAKTNVWHLTVSNKKGEEKYHLV